MTSTAILRNALEDIEIAFRQIEFTIKLLSYCELGKMSPEEFDTDHSVQLVEGDLHFPTKHFDKDNIIRAAEVNVASAFATSAIALDNAFEVMELKADPAASDDVGQCRVLVYMVRCAYAHRIAEPR